MTARHMSTPTPPIHTYHQSLVEKTRAAAHGAAAQITLNMQVFNQLKTTDLTSRGKTPIYDGVAGPGLQDPLGSLDCRALSGQGPSSTGPFEYRALSVRIQVPLGTRSFECTAL